MATKTTGVIFKAFYGDETYWKPGQYIDDQLITIDGVEDEEGIDINLIRDDQKITILGGTICNDNFEFDDYISLEKFFKLWLKQQTTEIVSVVIPKEDLEDFKEFLKQKKYKVI